MGNSENLLTNNCTFFLNNINYLNFIFKYLIKFIMRLHFKKFRLDPFNKKYIGN